MKDIKNLTLDEFNKIHENWKATCLSIRDYCSNTGFEEGKFYYWRKKLADTMLPQTKGFVPIQMSRQNGKISMDSTITPDVNAENNVACEIVYQNGVTLKVKSDMTLEMLRTLILLCQ